MKTETRTCLNPIFLKFILYGVLFLNLVLLNAGCSSESATGKIEVPSSSVLINSQLQPILIGDSGSMSITWDKRNFQGPTMNVDYSLDGGSTWINIETGATNNGSYTWTFPTGINSDEVYVRMQTSGDTNVTFAQTEMFAIDSTPPQAVSSVTPASDLVSGALNFSLNFSHTGADYIGGSVFSSSVFDTTLQGYEITLYQGSNCTGTIVSTNIIGTQSTNLSGLTNLLTYSAQVRAVDAAGNKSTAACSANVYVDINQPVMTITDASARPATNYSRVTQPTVNITNDTGAVYWCLTTSSGFSPVSQSVSACPQGGPANGWVTVRPTQTPVLSTPGVNTFYLWAADISGNITSLNPAQATINFDNTLPGAFSISGITGGTDVLQDAYLSDTSEAHVTWTASTDVYEYFVEIRNAGSAVLCTSSSQSASTTDMLVTPCSLTNSTVYKALVSSVDEAGNSIDTAEFTFTVANTLPTVNILSGPAQPNSADFDPVFTFTGTASPSVDHYDCELNSAITPSCTSPSSFVGVPLGLNTFKVRSYDALGRFAEDTHLWTTVFCSAGEYNLSEVCTVAPANSYSPALDNTLYSCPTNSNTNGTTGNSVITACRGNGGYYNCASGTCSAAGTNYYSANYDDTRSACPTNTSTNGATTSIAVSSCRANLDFWDHDTNSLTAAQAVGNGFYSLNYNDSRTACTNMPSNATAVTYSSSGGGANNCTVSSVTTCSLGYTPNGVVCEDTCGAGQYWTGATCTNVGIGYYSPAANNSRTACPANTSTSTTTSSSVNDCLANAGYWDNDANPATAAVAVGANNYSPALNNSLSSCPANTSTNSSTTSSAVSDCRANLDFWDHDTNSSTVAQAVGNGFYSLNYNDSRLSCTNLPANAASVITYSSSGGGANNCSVSNATCNGGYAWDGSACVLSCGAGQYYDGISCVNVGVGYYSPTSDSNRYSCPANTSTNSSTTSSAVSDCRANLDFWDHDTNSSTAAQAVGNGFYSLNYNDSRTACTNMPANATSVTYSSSGGGANNCTVSSVTACSSGYSPSGATCVLYPTANWNNGECSNSFGNCYALSNNAPITGSGTIYINNTGSELLEYSMNGGSWTVADSSLSVSHGNTVQFRMHLNCTNASVFIGSPGPLDTIDSFTFSNTASGGPCP